MFQYYEGPQVSLDLVAHIFMLRWSFGMLYLERGSLSNI